ncbi:hypothetical protein [Flavobacterium sp. ASV13]|uniref:hypothetical protein n=1 Tax=Flavobacterium sp. ASV13 TaxID=1506583 RepID=UPI001268FFE9|nr:hypothetical protein [Flavobacterium sp. ASV13]
MKTIAFDNEKAKVVEDAVSKIFDCRVSEIVSLKDTLVKKVVVFILFTSENYCARALAVNYQISYLYVPTVVAELEYMKKVVPGFELKIESVYKELKLKCNDNYSIRENGY